MRLRSVLLAILFPVLVYAQNYDIKIIVFEPLPALDFAGFIVTNGLQGTPNVFQIIVNTPTTPETKVRLQGKFYWKDVDKSTEEQMLEFMTRPLAAGTIMNSDLGVKIRLESHNEVDEVLNRNLAKGKPVGTYRLIMTLFPETGDIPLSPIVSDTKILKFENPTQTLSILTPTQGMTLDEGDINVSWTGVNAIKGDLNSYYYIRANQRTNSNQSLESVMESGNYKDVTLTGTSTSANLKSLGFGSNWLPGQEIVVQVCAKIGGIGGGETFKSQPVSFRLQQTINPATVLLTNTLNPMLQQFSSSIPQAIFNQFLQSSITIYGITDENGNVMSQADIQRLLNYLQSHPSDIVRILFKNN